MATNLHANIEGGVSSAIGGLLGQAALTTSIATIYTTPANSVAEIKNATVTNITGGAITLTLHVVPAAGAVANTNAVEFARSIAANTSQKLDSLIGDYLSAGASIRALASANTSLNLKLTGVVYS